jgi:hypothetical protein
MEAVRTSETSVDNYFTRKYIPEDKSELLHTRRRENLKYHTLLHSVPMACMAVLMITFELFMLWCDSFVYRTFPIVKSASYFYYVMQHSRHKHIQYLAVTTTK